MKFVIEKNILLEALVNVSRAISTRTTIPILNGIKFELKQEGLYLTATDSELTIKIFIEEKRIKNIESTGEAIIQSKYILDIIRKMPSDVINFEVINNNNIKISTNNNEYNLNCYDVADYPFINLDESKEPISLKANILKNMINVTSYAISNQEVRPLLTGLNLKITGDNLECIATDSYRLAKMNLILDKVVENVINIVIPGKSINEIEKIIVDDEEIILHIFNNKMIIKYKNIDIQTNLLSGTYPDTNHFIPKEFAYIINLDLKAFNDAVDRAALLAQSKDKNIVRVSIEDKIMRFSERPRHQLFIEPMGLDTDEYYLQGMSSSLPEDVQIAFLRTIKGLENVEIMRNAYAIEYDCCNPLDLKHTLEFKKIKGLYGAGQFNGTSGYEEAAGQGLIAGINAARAVKGLSEITLPRSSSYIGTLIDDLVIKGCSDPYRMMTSRSEYRLLLRQDNADERLTPIGHEIGLISDERYNAFLEKQAEIDAEIKRMKKTSVAPSAELNKMLEEKGTAPITNGIRFSELIKRPQISYEDLAPFDKDRQKHSYEVREQVNLKIEYEGYISRQLMEVEHVQKLEAKKLPQPFDYKTITGLSLEAMEKLNRIQPENIGQASRISGVSPADVSVLIIWLSQRR